MSEVSYPPFDYRDALQELIRELLETGWGEVVLSLTPSGEPMYREFASALQRLTEEFQMEARIEVWNGMVGYFFGPLECFTD